MTVVIKAWLIFIQAKRNQLRYIWSYRYSVIIHNLVNKIQPIVTKKTWNRIIRMCALGVVIVIGIT